MGTTGTDWSGETNHSGLEHAALAQTQRVESPHSVLVGVGCQNAGGMGCVYLTGIPGGRSAFIVREKCEAVVFGVFRLQPGASVCPTGV